MNRFELKKQRISNLLTKMAIVSMNRHEMAAELQVSLKVVGSYITQLKRNKKIYVYEYKRTICGTPTTHYKAGDFPNAQKLQRLTNVDYNRKFKTGVDYKVKSSKFIPTMDIAASWLLNPTN
jgi:predicted ArsR family transcriptional regulator